jgi:hypothetical protein
MADLIDDGLAQLIRGEEDVQQALSDERVEKVAFDADAVFGKAPSLLP